MRSNLSLLSFATRGSWWPETRKVERRVPRFEWILCASRQVNKELTALLIYCTTRRKINRNCGHQYSHSHKCYLIPLANRDELFRAKTDVHGARALSRLFISFQAFTPKLHHLRWFTACLVWPDSTTFKKLLLTNSLSALRRSIFFFSFHEACISFSYDKLTSRLVLRLARSIIAWRTFFSTGA